jgi:hypothetical protein
VLGYIKWTFVILFWVLVASFLHYTLPRWDIVRITDTYERRETFGENSIFWTHARTGGGASGDISRDIFFIQGVRPNGRPSVYRNEDTGFGWPPFFKINSADLQTRAADSGAKRLSRGKPRGAMRPALARAPIHSARSARCGCGPPGRASSARRPA